jgi:hypothetical protein
LREHEQREAAAHAEEHATEGHRHAAAQHVTDTGRRRERGIGPLLELLPYDALEVG